MRNDLDPVETSEWREAFDSVIEFDGADRAAFLLEEMVGEARRNGVPVPYSANTPYLNTIPPHAQPTHPGNSGDPCGRSACRTVETPHPGFDSTSTD